MSIAHHIRSAMDEVVQLRAAAAADPGLALAVAQVKRLQSRRFAATYADVLAQGPYRAAGRFFLEALYGDRDFGERDAQFARIAGSIEKLFPAQVADTAGRLASLHALTERLDLAMARAWKQPGAAFAQDAAAQARAYVEAWHTVGRADARQAQVAAVMGIGQALDRLTRLKGLRWTLRLMRGPAQAAGLGALQQFLEQGFDTFADMGQQGGHAAQFLALVQQRETALLARLHGPDTVACETFLTTLLGQAR